MIRIIFKRINSARKISIILIFSRVRLIVNVDIQNEQNLAERQRTIITDIREIRAKNTNAIYKSKQKKFKKWCASRYFNDRETVTEIKLSLFLKKYVTKRELKRRDRKSGAVAEIDL